MNSSCVDLIYLDPPFNSNANYAAPIGSKAAGAAFKDTWGLNEISEAWHGEIAHEHPGLYELLKATRQIHGDSMMAYLIYMAIRIMEMKRLMSPFGSIYLHCDQTASHYLKLLLDAIFGSSNYRNTITWKRHNSQQRGNQFGAKSWSRNADTILYYGNSKEAAVSPYRELSVEEAAKKFPLVDESGNRFYDDSSHIWSTPGMGARPNLCYEWKGYRNPHPSGWRLSRERMDEEYRKGNIVILPDGKLQRRKYLKDYAGVPLGSIWTEDELILSGNSAERTGYPTQKPRALLDRIISASTKKDEWVLDPFCGCATACVSAQWLGRKWVGIDISSKAADLVKSRINEELGEYYNGIHRTDIPTRTDLGKMQKYNHPEIKNELYGVQGGFCNGCEGHFEVRHFHVDHIIPSSKGGTDHFSNLQLLCGNCNSVKGNRTQEYLIACLTDKGWIKRRKAAGA